MLYDNFFKEYNIIFVLSSCLLYTITWVIQSYIRYRDETHKKLELKDLCLGGLESKC